VQPVHRWSNPAAQKQLPVGNEAMWNNYQTVPYEPLTGLPTHRFIQEAEERLQRLRRQRKKTERNDGHVRQTAEKRPRPHYHAPVKPRGVKTAAPTGVLRAPRRPSHPRVFVVCFQNILCIKAESLSHYMLKNRIRGGVSRSTSATRADEQV
jgi:hypothetical protein